MDKIYSPIKERVVQYIEFKKIKKEFFFKEIGVSASNFKGKGAKSELGGEKIVQILTIYNEINPEWLILGKGEMLKNVSKDFIAPMQEEAKNIDYKDKYCEVLEKYFALNEEIRQLKSEPSQKKKTHCTICTRCDCLKIKEMINNIKKEI